jgi:hypothetical protein
LLGFAILFKAFLLCKHEKSAGFLQSAYLAVILSTSENVRGVESSRLGVCARLVGQAVSRAGAASRRVFPFRRGVVLARRGFFRLRSFEILRKKRSGARLTLVQKGKNDVEEVCVFLGRRFLGFGFGRERLGARRGSR